jgi:hypothetical protein
MGLWEDSTETSSSINLTYRNFYFSFHRTQTLLLSILRATDLSSEFATINTFFADPGGRAV